MKLPKNYLLKKSKSDEIISFTFPIVPLTELSTTLSFAPFAKEKV